MLMRAVFASAMLIGLAATANADIKVIYPPYSYQPTVTPWIYLEDYDCGRRHRYRHYDMAAVVAAIPGQTQATMAKVMVLSPSYAGQ